MLPSQLLIPNGSSRAGHPSRFAAMLLLACVSLAVLNPSTVARACPFCSAINLTFTEQLASKDIAVVAKLLTLPKPVSDPDAELPKASLVITKVLKGDKYVSIGMEFKVVVVGTYPVGQEFLVMGVDPPNVSWTTPMKASKRMVGYLEAIQDLPEEGADRLAFFQDYFEDEESTLAFDAYDEFAKAPYQDLIDLKDRMSKDSLVKWIKDPELSHNRRRLYLTMLGVCGGHAEADVLSEFIKSGDRVQQAGLDALLASYLTLKGADGLPLIVETFLTNKETEYVDVLAAVSALRFHGTEVDVVPREAIVAAVRHVLDRPRMADMVIPDLARWEDWSVMERLVKMFKDADDETNWLRVPVITYLQECPLPAAKTHIEELTEIDPDAVRRAEFFAQSLDGFGDEDDGEEADPDEDTAPAATEDQADSTAPETGSTGDAKQTIQYVSRRVPMPQAIAASTNASTTEAATGAMVVAESKSGSESDAANGPIAKTLPAQSPNPIAVATPVANLTALIVFVPMAASVLIFVVLWSVVSGWFERLIF